MDEFIKISLTEQDFKDLVQGKTITTGKGNVTVDICLQDIGFYKMASAIVEATKIS